MKRTLSEEILEEKLERFLRVLRQAHRTLGLESEMSLSFRPASTETSLRFYTNGRPDEQTNEVARDVLERFSK